jgi:biopolymer transport protein ExbD
MARKTPEINSSSQADIAFLLLCFFLMTTSMDVDYGITRRLPPPVEQNDDDVKVKERNVMNVLVNKNDRLMVNGYPSDISMLKDEAKRFMTPNPNDPTAPEVEPKMIENLGEVLMSKGVISLQNDRGTSYAMYISVQNELARAFNELKDEMSMKQFNKHYDKLTNEDQIKAINEAVPVRVSEAEPVEIVRQ